MAAVDQVPTWLDLQATRDTSARDARAANRSARAAQIASHHHQTGITISALATVRRRDGGGANRARVGGTRNAKAGRGGPAQVATPVQKNRTPPAPPTGRAFCGEGMDQHGPGGPSGYGGPSRRVVTPALNTQDQPEGSPGGSGGLNGHSAGGSTGDGGPVVAAGGGREATAPAGPSATTTDSASAFRDVWTRLCDPTLPRHFRSTTWAILHGIIGVNAFIYHTQLQPGRPSPDPATRLCRNPTCLNQGVHEDISHAFLQCPAVAPAIDWLLQVWQRLSISASTPSTSDSGGPPRG